MSISNEIGWTREEGGWRAQRGVGDRSSGTFGLLLEMVIDLTRSIDLRWLFDPVLHSSFGWSRFTSWSLWGDYEMGSGPGYKMARSAVRVPSLLSFRGRWSGGAKLSVALADLTHLWLGIFITTPPSPSTQTPTNTLLRAAIFESYIGLIWLVLNRRKNNLTPKTNIFLFVKYCLLIHWRPQSPITHGALTIITRR